MLQRRGVCRTGVVVARVDRNGDRNEMSVAFDIPKNALALQGKAKLSAEKA
jgi:hypothetical protein